jgi:hypothetical protein
MSLAGEPDHFAGTCGSACSGQNRSTGAGIPKQVSGGTEHRIQRS